jgi:hypothetical protein
MTAKIHQQMMMMAMKERREAKFNAVAFLLFHLIKSRNLPAYLSLQNISLFIYYHSQKNSWFFRLSLHHNHLTRHKRRSETASRRATFGEFLCVCLCAAFGILFFAHIPKNLASSEHSDLKEEQGDMSFIIYRHTENILVHLRKICELSVQLYNYSSRPFSAHSQSHHSDEHVDENDEAQRVVKEFLAARTVYRHFNQPIGDVQMNDSQSYSIRGYFIPAPSTGYQFITHNPIKQFYQVSPVRAFCPFKPIMMSHRPLI